MSDEPSLPDIPSDSSARTLLEIAARTAADSPEMRDAGRSLARTTRTIAGTIEACLMPLAAVNFGIEKAKSYFSNKFSERLKERTRDIPLDMIREPKPSVAAPALQGLAFAHEELSLEDLYLGLLSTAMDGREPGDAAHPAYVEVIKQLTGREADLLKRIFFQSRFFEIVHFAAKPVSGDYMYRFLSGPVCNFRRPEALPSEIESFDQKLSNWTRLGLLDLEPDAALVGDHRYAWIEDRPEYRRAIEGLDETRETILVLKGRISLTPFGRDFARAVGVSGLSW